jgi:hypothetical protein
MKPKIRFERIRKSTAVADHIRLVNGMRWLTKQWPGKYRMSYSENNGVWLHGIMGGYFDMPLQLEKIQGESK